MRLFHPASAGQLNLGLTVLRVITGIVFAAHGAQKLFVFGFEGVAGAFGQMGIPMAAVAGPAVALLEFVGGLALVAGLMTRVTAFGLSVVMLGAVLLVHLAGGFFMPNGYEFALTLFGATAALAIMGAGSYSADAIIARRGALAS